MISTISIYNAIANAIEKETGCTVYSNEVLEGFSAPCFFLKVSEREVSDCGLSTIRRTVDVALNYLPPANGKRVRNEKDGNEMAFVLHKLFNLNIHIEDRYLLITNRRHDFGGENFDILIFSFDMSFFDDYSVKEDAQPAELIEHVDISNK